jgi:WD40 repeat protein
MRDTWAEPRSPDEPPARQLERLWECGERPDVDALLAGRDLSAGDIAAALAVDQWRRWRAGERVPAEDYLRRHPRLAHDSETALELIYGEWLVREELGERPDAAEYLARFPHWAERLTQQLALHGALGSGGLASAATLGDGSGGQKASAPGTVAGYEIRGELGRGGMGVVYRAWQPGLRRHVALKMVLAGTHAGPDTLARFRTEGEAIARLQHPHIVQVYECGEEAGRPFYALEYVEGGSLAQKLARGPLPVREAAELVETLARAIHFAHEKGIVHRDLKPANVMLQQDGTPKVTDFGLAKILADGTQHTASGAILGTPSYMAPEQAGQGGEVGPACDVYALGAILYELLTGRPPFRADTPMDTLQQVVKEEPVSPARLQPKVPRDLETITLKCLQKEPPGRYSSALELADDLGRFLRGEPVRARPLGRLARLGRWCRRNPAVAAAGALAVLALLAAVGVSVGFALYQARSAGELRQALRESDRLSAGLALDRGLSLCDQGDVRRGLLWLARSLELAVRARDVPLQRAIRINLAAWGAELHPLRNCLVHEGFVRAVEFSPDGTRILTGSADGTARLWDGASGKPLAAPLRHAGPVPAVAFRPDGGVLATGCADGTAHLWDAATRQRVVGPLRHGDRIDTVAFSSKGKRLLTVGAGRARLWDAATGKPLAHLGESTTVSAAVFSGDGGRVLTGAADGSARLWAADTGAAVGLPLKHRGPVRAVALSPDGSQALIGEEARRVTLWDLGTHRSTELTPAHGAAVLAVGFNHAGTALFSASRDWRVHVWRLEQGRPTLRGKLEHLAPVRAAAFSPDGSLILTGSFDGRARLWDAAAGTLLGNPLPFEAEVHAVAFRPDGRAVLVGGNDRSARVWGITSAAPGLTHFKHPEWIYTAALHLETNLLATGGEGDEDCPIRLFDVATGKPRGVLAGHPGTVRALAVRDDGAVLVSGGGDRTARLWDVATRKEVYRTPHARSWVSAVGVSPDRRLLLTGTLRGEVVLWEPERKARLLSVRHHEGPIYTAVFSPDGRRFLTAGADLRGQLWDTATGRPVGGRLHHEGQVWSAVFSPDSRVALTGSDDQTVRFWETAGGKALGAPLVDPYAGRTVAVSPDGRTLLKGDMRKASRLWDVATRKPLGPMINHQGAVLAAAFDRTGRRVVLVTDEDRAIRACRVPSQLEGEPARLTLWVEVVTGMELGPDDGPLVLEAGAWHERRRRLEVMGGAPLP